MTERDLRSEHQSKGAMFAPINGVEAILHYGDPHAEYAALRQSAGLLDLSHRGRLVVTGADRLRFLNGQVTNKVRDLRPGAGCYAAVVNAKGKVQGDLNIYCLAEELLLDCEPGQGERIAARLEQFVIADDVRVVDLGGDYGLLSVQGPMAATVLAEAFPGQPLPDAPWASVVWTQADSEICVVRLPRFESDGFELYVPAQGLISSWQKLHHAVAESGGRICGWQAMEWTRVESGLPRYPQDMDERNLAPEAGIEERAISYTKGCYIGQEVISRVRNVGQVTRSLRGMELDGFPKDLPQHGDRLMLAGRDVGYITSAIFSPGLKRPIALGYVRREVQQPEATFEVHSECGVGTARLHPLPFLSENSAPA